MCGILGTVDVPVGREQLDLLAHRGPDDSGMGRVAIGEHEVYFGQRRLSILDLSDAGHQPMYSDCGEYAIIFNGEIYNHEILREKLGGNHVFNGHSDTETILYYLKKFGIEGVKDFNGIFAFAFLDKQQQKLFLARDPFGVKPLYYHFEESFGLIFSSELRPISSVLGPAELDLEALASLLRLRYNPSPDTLDRRIRKLRPGHYLELGLENCTLHMRCRAFAGKRAPAINGVTSSHPLRAYGNALEAAVKRQLLSDVEIGILLSGGVDSALVAALAQRHSSQQLKAFTIGFEGNYAEDEIEDAAETAQLLGLEHHCRKISFTDFLGVFKTCTQIVEEPLATTSMIPMYYLAELAAGEVKVVLTGQGADEPLGGYDRYKLELIRSRIPGFLRGALLSATRHSRLRNEQILRGAQALGIGDEIDRFLAVYQVFSPSEIEQLISVRDSRSRKRIQYFHQLLGPAEGSMPVERMMALDARLNLADDLLNYTDKITMHFSLECRVPMLDLELVRFIEALPLDWKLKLGGGKIIHKQFARQLLPERIVNRKKKAFQSPTKEWFRKEAGVLKDILLSEDSHFSRLFNRRYVACIIDQHGQGFNREKQLFLLLGIYFWLESQ